jgi:hypothetical protein
MVAQFQELHYAKARRSREAAKNQLPETTNQHESAPIVLQMFVKIRVDSWLLVFAVLRVFAAEGFAPLRTSLPLSGAALTAIFEA